MKLSVPSFYEAECIRLRAELEDASEKSAPSDRASCRDALNDLRMVHDLRRNHLRYGISRSRVLHMLGDPTERDQDRLYYYLAPDAIGMDTDEPVVIFGHSGRLIRVGWTNT